MDKLLIKLVCSAKPVKVTGINTYTSLLSYGIDYGRNNFYGTGPSMNGETFRGLHYKTFYGRNLGAPL